MERKSVVRGGQHVSGGLEYYTIYSTVDITASGDYADQSQQNWDSIVTVMSMRAQPVVLNQPEAVADLAAEGSNLTGAGFMFTFAVEHKEVFATHDGDHQVIDPVGVLKHLLDGITLGEHTVSTDVDPNLEIVYAG